MTYKERVQPLRDSMDAGNGRDSSHVHRNVKLLLAAREGEYLLKKQGKFECEMGIGYLQIGFWDTNWGGWGRRRSAQWFSREEAAHFSNKWPGVKMVKRSKSGK